MATLADLLASRLDNLKTMSDGWTAACPACRAEGHDSQGNHLRIWRNGAFNCAKIGSDDGGLHNKAIRAFIYEGADSATVAAMQVAIIDPEPKLEADPVYPEDMLARTLQDHSYWMGRGISEDVLRRLEGGLVSAEPRSKLSGRYVFPIRDPATRRIVGWTGRLVSDASFGPKHKHLVRVKKAVYPWTVNEAAIKRARKVVLLESIGDGLALSSAGIDYWLLLLGLHINSRTLGYLVGANLDEVIISTNNDAIGEAKSDEAGNKAAEALRGKLVPFLGDHKVRIRLPQTRKDWCATLEARTGELDIFRAELEGRAPTL